MAAMTFEPVNRQSTTTLARAFPVSGQGVPQGFEYSVAVRVCALGSTDSIVDLQLRKTDGTNLGYRAKAHPVPAGGGTYDLETSLTLPAGYELWDRCGANDVSVSYTGTLRAV